MVRWPLQPIILVEYWGRVMERESIALRKKGILIHS